MTKTWRYDLLLLFAAVGLLFGLGLGARPYLTPSEARYIEIPRQMLATGDWLTPRINGVPYFEKPPLFYWMQATAMRAFGDGEFAGRLVTALFSTLTCLLTYATGRMMFGRLSGLLAAGALATSLMGYGLSRVATLDVPVSFFITSCMACFWAAQPASPSPPAGEGRGGGALAMNSGPSQLGEPPHPNPPPQGGREFYLLMYIFSALAVMTKGLIGIVVPGLVIGTWIAITGQWRILREARLATGLVVFLLITAPWHIAMARTHPDFLNFYFIHEHVTRYLTDEHKRTAPWWFFIVVTLAGLLPWATLPPLPPGEGPPDGNGFHADRPSPQGRGGREFLYLWILLPLLFFSSSHSKLIPYIFPIFPPLCILIGNRLALLWTQSVPVKPLRLGAALTVALWAALILASQLLPILPGKLGQKVSAVSSQIPLVSLYPLMLALLWVAYAAWRSSPKRLILALMGLGAVTGVSANYLAASLDTASIKPLAESLRPRLRDGDMVVAYGSYWQDLPVYLRRNVTVAGWTGELTFGVEHYPQTHAWMMTTDEFRQRCAGAQRLYVFVRENAAATLPETCRLQLAAAYGKTLLFERTTP